MDFLKKYWKYILGLVIYTVLVVFISITAYKGYLGNKINNAFKDVFNSSFNDSGDNKILNNESEKNNVENQIITTKQMNIDETITTQDWEITLKGTEFSQDVTPPAPAMFYSHYQVKDTTNTYLVVKLDMKNISALSLTADDNISLKAIYNGKYEYKGFSTLLSQDNSNFDYTNITSIAPLTNRTLYYLVEMPKNITEDDNEIEIQLTAYQTKYTYKIVKNTVTISKEETNNTTEEIKVEPTNTTNISNRTNTSSAKKNNTQSSSQIKKEVNPYEEDVVFIKEMSGQDTSTNLDNYINNYITNEPIPVLPSSNNDENNNIDYLSRGIEN